MEPTPRILVALALLLLACSAEERRPREESPRRIPAPAEAGAREASPFDAARGLLDSAREARARGDYETARTKASKACETLLAEDAASASPAALELLGDASRLALDLGDLDVVERAQRRVCDELSKSLPDDAADLQAARVELGIAIFRRGDVPGARALFQQVVDVETRTLPDDHPDLQKARMNLAVTLKLSGDLAGARALLERVLEIDSRALADDDPDLLSVQQNLATTVHMLGDLERARALQQRVIDVRSRSAPDDDPDLAAARGNLAVTIEELGDLEGALALEEKVTESFAKTLPPDHPRLQQARMNLAGTLFTLGHLPEARALFEGVVEVFSKTLPESHPDLQGARMNLAVTLNALGDLAEARELEERVLEADAAALPDDHPSLQDARSSLASTLKDMGDAAGARALEEKVLEVCARTLPEDHPRVQQARENLAITLKSLGDLAKARELLEKVLEVRLRILGTDDPDLQRARLNLAAAEYADGDLESARSLLETVHEVLSRTLPDDHPDLQGARQSLAATIAALVPKTAAAEVPVRKARFDELARSFTDALRRSASTAITESSTREAEERITSANGALSTALSFAAGLGVCGDDERRERDVFLASETMRGAALASARIARAAKSDASYAQTRTRASRASEELARLAQLGASAEAFGKARAELEEAERDLVRLASKVPGSGAKALAADFDALAAHVAEDEALVAYRRYLRTSFSPGIPPESSVESLCAFVLRAGGKLSRVELGPLSAIEAAVESWREAIAGGRERGLAADAGSVDRAASAGGELRARVLDPLQASLSGARRAIVVLDDVLHAVALDALSAGKNTGETANGDASDLVGSRLRIETRTSLLELLDAESAPSSEPSLVAVGDAAFNSAPVATSDEITPASSSSEAPLLAQASERPAGVLRRSAWERGFSFLPETRAEVMTIGETFAEVFGERSRSVVLDRRKASRESLFETAPSARFLHVATHGWFAPDSVRSIDEETPLDKQTGIGRRMSAEERVRGMAPMLLSGVALAGANLPAGPTGRIPGIVTAAELATLDLAGCELAVLSACDSNVGVRRAGQGVASLQRALHMAGAHSVITSLWRVPDEATKDLMVDFYRRLWVEKKPKAQALWEAKMKIRGTKDEAGKPIYSTRDWAAWVLTGNPE